MGTVTALRYSALETDFVDEVIWLLLQADTLLKQIQNAALISSEVAAVNGLSVGDKIVLVIFRA